MLPDTGEGVWLGCARCGMPTADLALERLSIPWARGGAADGESPKAPPTKLARDGARRHFTRLSLSLFSGLVCIWLHVRWLHTLGGRSGGSRESICFIHYAMCLLMRVCVR